MKTDQSLQFLNHFVGLYEELLNHTGYGDINIHIRHVGPKAREVIVRSGKEYRFLVRPVPPMQKGKRFQVTKNVPEATSTRRRSEWRAMPLHIGHARRKAETDA